MPPIYEWIIVAHTTVVSQNGMWHVHFFCMLKYLCKPLLNTLSICSNLICFKVQMTLGVQLGLEKPRKSIFEPEEDLNYFDKINIINMWFDSVMLATWWTSKHSHMSHCIGCHTCAFTVAYALLWLEVLLHINVFHIRCATMGGVGSPPILSWKSWKNALVSEKKALIFTIRMLNLPFKT